MNSTSVHIRKGELGNFATPTRPVHVLTRYVVAATVVLGAWGGRKLLAPIIGEPMSPLFYLAVILGAWYGGLGPGLFSTFLAGLIAAWVFIAPTHSFAIGWGGLLRLLVFLAEALLIGSLTANRRSAEVKLRQARDELELRVQERTAALEARSAELQASNDEMQRHEAERRHMQQVILEISEREQQRIGHDLHDGLGQDLTGIAFLSKALAEELAAQNRPEAEAALEVVGLVNQTIARARELARGLLPAELESEGLGTALRQLALRAETLFDVECQFEAGSTSLPARDLVSDKHVYRIAQEAINNAVKHGHPRRLKVTLKSQDGSCALTVSDDGVGFTPPQAGHTGIGLGLMNYRARMIGGRLEVTRAGERGTHVTCMWPLRIAPKDGAIDAAARTT